VSADASLFTGTFSQKHMTLKQIAVAFAFVLVATAAHAQTNRDGDRVAGQITFGFDGQNYSSGRTVSVASMDATIRLLPRLTLDAIATGGSYFGERFGGGGSYFTLKPDRKTYLTAGGSLNSNTNTTSAWSGSFEIGRTLYQSERDSLPAHHSIRRGGLIRALETTLSLIDRGYSFSPAVNVLLVSPAATIYFPRDWTLTLRAGAIRETIGSASTWTPSGGAKLNIPLTRRLSVMPGVAFDSELSNVLQINNVSSREFGGGARYWVTRSTSASAYYFRVLYGANHLVSDSYGVNYVVRF
jgi:hypothetical protein